MPNVSRFLAAAAIGFAAIGLSAPAFAGLIVLSGDGNFANALDGSGSVSLDTDNQQFFSNVLGGGTNVVVQSTSGSGSPSISVADTAVNNYYNGLGGGVTSSLVSGPITAATLSGTDLFVVVVPDVGYTGAEVGAFSAFLSGNGTMFLLGENGSFTTQNGFINSLLASLGSSMSIVDAAVSGAHPLPNSLTAGVGDAQFVVGSIVSGGTALFVDNNNEGAPVIAFESVPEPATIALFGIGLAGLGFSRRRKRA